MAFQMGCMASEYNLSCLTSLALIAAGSKTTRTMWTSVSTRMLKLGSQLPAHLQGFSSSCLELSSRNFPVIILKASATSQGWLVKGHRFLGEQIDSKTRYVELPCTPRSSAQSLCHLGQIMTVCGTVGRLSRAITAALASCHLSFVPLGLSVIWVQRRPFAVPHGRI